MATLKQIALELGVSHTLVSKVLSGRMGTSGVSAPVRKAILAKAKTYNFRPSQVAIAFRNGRKGAIGVFLHRTGSPGSELTQNFLQKISDGLAAGGERVLLRFYERDEQFYSSLEHRLQDQVDGIIVGGVSHPEVLNLLREMDSETFPVVIAPSGGDDLNFSSSVRVDNEAQGYLATQHLIEKGCRNIASFKTHTARHAGCVRALLEAGRTVRPDLIISNPNYDLDAGVEMTTTLLERRVDFDGLVAASDSQALGALRVFAHRNIRVPKAVRLTGVDDSPLALAGSVPLTSVSAEFATCGRLAANMLLDRLAGKKVVSQLVLPHLYPRASTA